MGANLNDPPPGPAWYSSRIYPSSEFADLDNQPIYLYIFEYDVFMLTFLTRKVK